MPGVVCPECAHQGRVCHRRLRGDYERLRQVYQLHAHGAVVSYKFGVTQIDELGLDIWRRKMSDKERQAEKLKSKETRDAERKARKAKEQAEKAKKEAERAKKEADAKVRKAKEEVDARVKKTKEAKAKRAKEAQKSQRG